MLTDFMISTQESPIPRLSALRERVVMCVEMISVAMHTLIRTSLGDVVSMDSILPQT